MSKSKNKTVASSVSIRVHSQSKEKASMLLNSANKKKFGRKIKLDDLIDLAIGLVTNEHLKMLQERSMTNEDRKELLRQKYIETRGPITRDEFTGFMLTNEFSDFMKQTDRPGETSNELQ